jgi:hypothetical protein
MKHVWRVSVLSAMVLVLTGCTSVTGTWKLDTITPGEAREGYPLASVTLHKDGTYVAMMPHGEKMVASHGEYTFENNQLCFTSEKGKERTYEAKLIALGAKLEVQTEMAGEPVTAIMKRAKCEKSKCEKHEGCEKCEKHEECEKHKKHEKHE